MPENETTAIQAASEEQLETQDPTRVSKPVSELKLGDHVLWSDLGQGEVKALAPLAVDSAEPHAFGLTLEMSRGGQTNGVLSAEHIVEVSTKSPKAAS